MNKSSYYINEKDEFIIEGYNQKKPFPAFCQQFQDYMENQCGHITLIAVSVWQPSE